MTHKPRRDRRSRAAAVAAEPPAPSRREAVQIEVASKRVAARRERFSISAVEKAGTLAIEPIHNDMKGWSARALDAFGTNAPDFAMHMVDRLSVVAKQHGAKAPTQRQLNAALAFVDGIEPENEMEAMLATNLYATNELALTMLAQARQATDIPNLELAGGLAVKLLREATRAAEALNKIKRGGQQVVKVVHVYPGGQAIVGDVHQAPGGGVPQILEDQTHAKAISYAPVGALFSVNEAGELVPIASDAEWSVPNARGQDAGRTQG